MRLSTEQIEIIANRIVRGLAKRGYFDVDDADEIELMVQEVMTPSPGFKITFSTGQGI